MADCGTLNVFAPSPNFPNSFVETLIPNMMILYGGLLEIVRFR